MVIIGIRMGYREGNYYTLIVVITHPYYYRSSRITMRNLCVQNSKILFFDDTLYYV